MYSTLRLFAVLSVASPLLASDITWGSAQLISGDGDIPAAGSAVWAYHLDPAGASSAVTINGVTFLELSGSNADVTFTDLTATPLAFAGSSVFGGASSDYTALSAGYRTLLGGAGYWDNASGRVTLNNLTVGVTYTFRLWGNDARANAGSYGRQVLASDENGHAATYDLNSATVGGSVGRFLDGTFTADAGTQSFTLAKVSGGAAQLNAIMLSATPVPEPAHYGLAGAGLLVAARALRRRRAGKRAA